MMVYAILVLVLVAILSFSALFLFYSHEEEWPAISDEEFLAKCPPGTDPEIALRVRRIVADQLYVSYERIHPEQDFIDDLQAG